MFIKRKCINFCGSVGKKTVLLQDETSACVSELANVQFCTLTFHDILFFCLHAV